MKQDQRLQQIGGQRACDPVCGVWGWLGHGLFSGMVNMQRDREMLAAVRNGTTSRPLLRFYCWEKPTVSLGLNQKADGVVNRLALERYGYDLVTRPTGGRALLHKGDLCYAIAARRSWHHDFRSLTSTYRAISAAIMLALKHLGLPESMAPEARSVNREYVNPCFAMLSPFEVLVHDRKICGSAQFRSGDCFLQHGSIRIRDNWSRDDLISIWPPGISLSADTITSIDRELGREVTVVVVREALLAALKDSFGANIRSVSA